MKFKVLKLYLVLMTVMTTVTYADSCCNVSCNQSCNTSCCNNSCNSCCNNSCNSCCDSAVNVCGNLNNSAIDAIARANCCKPVCRDCETKCCQTACHRCCAISKNTWLPRSFVSYQTHNLFQNHYAYLDGSYDDEEHHINIASTFEYMQNFGAKCNSCCRNLGAMPFWSGTNTLTIGNNDGRANLDAYQLGLGNVVVDENGIAGVIQLNPEVQQAGADLSLYYVHSKECYGFYFRVNAPLASMRVKPNLVELMTAVSDNSVSFSQTTTAGDDNPASAITYEFYEYPVPSVRAKSVSDYFFGGTMDGATLDGNETKPIHLRRGRIAPCAQTAIRLGDITAAFGYNAYMGERGFFGLGVKASFPTGNVPTAHYMLEPIVGRAGAWGLGGEICSSIRVWENCDGTRNLSVLMQGEVMHLFRGRTPNFRTFDLAANGPGSKYLLVQHYTETYDVTGTAPLAAEVELPLRLHPAANITTLPVISKIAVEGSFAVALDYAHNDWNVALGGEFWGRSRECLQIDLASAADLRLPNLNEYAVVGRQVSAYAVNGQPFAAAPTFNPVRTYFVEPLATICRSQDPVQLVGTVPNVVAPTTLPDGIADGRDSANRIPADLCTALDIAGAAAQRAFTGRIFGQAGYTWSEHCHAPSLAVVGGAEFTGRRTNNAVQFWSVGLQGSLNF